MADFQAAKALVLQANAALDAGDADALKPFVAPEYRWRGMHPFHELQGAEAVEATFWGPLRAAMGPLQRRPDIFFAGLNQTDDWTTTWVVEMGHLLGLWDTPWLGIAPSRKIAFLRYCEFHRVEGGRIAETAYYCDLLNLLAQDGRSPISQTPGMQTLTPGPRTHDGLLYGAHDAAEGRETIELVAAMVADLRGHKVSSPIEHLEQFWTPDMTWFGPGGIGASAFFNGYRRGHIGPFEEGLDYVRHTEHVARLGEGMYGGFFGFPSLTMTSKGYLGQPPSDVPADMRIVDLYRRQDDKLAENWIFIDLPHFFNMQGIDLLGQVA